nr:MAG TPA: hypothetical protein [Caudoviricetes sp.]
MSNELAIDMCKGCSIPKRAEMLDEFESEYYFSCTDCACFHCPHLHSCTGQCAESGC